MREVLQRVVDSLKGKSKEKKLADIEQYINNNFEDADCILNEPDDLLDYLEVQFTEEDINNLYYILDQSYSQAYPYYIFNMELNEGVQAHQLISNIVDNLGNVEFVHINDKFDFNIDLNYVENSEDNASARVRINYKQYKIARTIRGIERVNEARHGYFNCEFLFDNSLLLINTGDRSLAGVVYDYISRNYYRDARIIPFKITPTSYTYTGPIDENRITIFLLELLTSVLPDNSHIINDYIKLGFENPNGQRVKSIRVGGNDLLNATEAAEQVRNNFTLKQVEFSMTWIINPQAAVRAVIAIDITATLKIIIRDISVSNYKIDFLLYIYNKISTLRNNGISLNAATSIIEHYFNSVVSRQKAQQHVLILDIRDKLIRHPSLSPFSGFIDEILDEYRR